MGTVQDFILWSLARDHEAAILDDVSKRFRILDLVDIAWSEDRFASNLTTFYGTNLPAGSDKEQHCGTGPFLLAIVEDERPRYRLVRNGTRWSVVNTRLLEAKQAYRALTGGGHRVHASLNPQEAAQDLGLLFGMVPADFLGQRVEGRTPRTHTGDVLGAHGWSSVDDILLALAVTTGERVLRPLRDGTMAIGVYDAWWAERVLNGRVVTDGVYDVPVGTSTTRIEVRELRRPRWRRWLDQLPHEPAIHGSGVPAI